MKKRVRRWLKALLVLFLSFLAIRIIAFGVVFPVYIIVTGSMIPTFQVGDVIFASRFYYDLFPLERRDVVVFKTHVRY